jgi:hypothetical protein
MHSFVSCPLVLNQGTSAVFRSAAPGRGFWLLHDGAHPLLKQWAILGCPSGDRILRRMICTRAWRAWEKKNKFPCLIRQYASLSC